jgi:tyrosyl-tRNA synthetase
VLFDGGDLRTLSGAELEDGLGEAPRTTLPRDEFALGTLDLTSAVVRCGLAPSRSQARTFVQQGAVSVNHEVVRDEKRVLGPADLLAGRFVVLRRGKKTHGLLDVTG